VAAQCSSRVQSPELAATQLNSSVTWYGGVHARLRLYWAPAGIKVLRERLVQLGYSVSEIVDRDYGQTEFFVTDDDGYSHCFGVATNKGG
jgi:hypothetical protein